MKTIRIEIRILIILLYHDSPPSKLLEDLLIMLVFPCKPKSIVIFMNAKLVSYEDILFMQTVGKRLIQIRRIIFHKSGR